MDRGYNSQCVLAGKASVFRGGTFLPVETLGWPQLQHRAVGSLQWVCSQSPVWQAAMGTAVLEFGVPDPRTALPWLPEQPVPQLTAQRHEWSQGRACRTVEGRVSTCSSSQHPVMNSDSHVFPPSSENVFAKHSVSGLAGRPRDSINTTLVAGLAHRQGEQQRRRQLSNYLCCTEKRIIRQLLASRQRYRDKPGFVV